MLNGPPTANESLNNESQKDGSMMPPSGVIYLPSAPSNCLALAAWWGWLALDSPVQPSQSRASAEEHLIPGIYSPIPCESLKKPDPSMSCSKMSEASYPRQALATWNPTSRSWDTPQLDLLGTRQKLSGSWLTQGMTVDGAPQKRERWFCWGVANGSMADPIYDGSYRETGHEAESGSYEPPDRVLERGDCTNGAIPMWPPAPSDRDGWARLLASRPDLAPAITEEVESALLRAPDGRSYRVDQLKSIGNLVVPATVALALSILAGGERMPRRRPPLIHG
jgi:hypothetical protein